MWLHILLVSGTITIDKAGADHAVKRLDERNKVTIFKNCSPFTDLISKKDRAQIENVNDLDVVISIYTLIEYSNSYSRTSGGLWQYYKDYPNDILTNPESLKFTAI